MRPNWLPGAGLAPRPAARHGDRRTPRGRRRLWLLGLAALVLCGGALAAWELPMAVAGQALHDGRQALQGRLAGHEDALPPEALRCANCHTGDSGIGPRLDGRLLLESRARRGGPPSRYDEAAFCRVLREGIDPASVVLPREMPRYDIGEADCRALWTYLSRS